MEKTSLFLRQGGSAIAVAIMLLTAGSIYAHLWESRYDHLIQKIAHKHGICPCLVKAIIKAESNFDPKAVSPRGDKGLMQLAPSTAEWFNVKNPFDPAENIEGGVRYLKYLKVLFDEDLDAMVCAYNAGHGRQRIPKSTRAYAKTVLAYRDKYEREGFHELPWFGN